MSLNQSLISDFHVDGPNLIIFDFLEIKAFF